MSEWVECWFLLIAVTGGFRCNTFCSEVTRHAFTVRGDVGPCRKVADELSTMKQLQDPLLVAVDSDIDIEKAVVVGPKSACRNLPPPIQGLHEILTGTKKHELFQMYPVRWFVLFVFCLVSFNQGMFWMTFAPISNLTVEYFHLQCNTSALLNSTTTAASTVDGCGGVDSAEAVAFLHLWGPMFSVFFLPIVSCVSRTSGSSRKLLVWAATLSIVSGILRVLPETPFLVSTSKDVIYVIHISQAINGCVGSCRGNFTLRCLELSVLFLSVPCLIFMIFFRDLGQDLSCGRYPASSVPSGLLKTREPPPPER